MLKDFRCKKCNKLLFKYKDGVYLMLEIKCDRCGTVNIINNQDQRENIEIFA